MTYLSRSSGFTLIEMLLSVLTLSVIAGISVPVYVSYQNRTELESKAFELTSMIRRAQVYARSSVGDSQWGVHIQSGASATLFEGANYATRDTAEDEVLFLPPTITTSGPGTIVFTKVAGVPNTSGTITLTSSPINQTRAITVNSIGMVSY